MTETNEWARMSAADPEHSSRYVARFRGLAADGVDLDGEARLVDAMLARGSRVLDAGCGPGRVGAALHAAGHEVVGVDADPVLVAAAQADHPGPTWQVGDLAELSVPGRFDVVVCAGNVMAFLAPSTRRRVLAGFRAHVVPGGRAVTGFGAERGYPFPEFLDDARAVGWSVDLLLSTWDLQPFTDDADFLVAVLS
ncbi:bifunctional 2-polyprenyl-6-hydroxyphenol methylase/3-demethylubiquinol 3-O-methyltransferase UbiG [Modestobacter sp. Leaf380]|uniref:class I SAM-dependent methyltransferase n=1 Tax=Modestobacter sp. Leaf380 TaxID=1736356 RepID=UPI000ACB6161|nr:class I SAM-dependent methyltransferase [Modestobacter sp. Leaf380]